MLRNLSISIRLLLLTLLPILAVTSIILIAISDMRSLIKSTESIYSEAVVPSRDLKLVSDALTVETVNLFQSFHQETLTYNQLMSDLNKAQSTYQQYWASYLESIGSSEEELALANDVTKLIERSQSLISDFTNQAESGALVLMDFNSFNFRLNATFGPLRTGLDNLVEYQLNEASALKDQSVEQFSKNLILFISIGTAVIILLLVFGWRISSSIKKPIASLSNSMSRISAESDLRIRADVAGKDEIALLSKSFNGMMNHFQSLIENLVRATHQLAASAEEMSAISQQVSGTAQEQEQQTTMIATAINQMTAAISEVASNAQNASYSAEQANELAKKGQDRSRRTVSAIESLAQSIEQSAVQISALDEQTQRITEVLDVIEGIAEQTNLLALNAAIEAARAGDAGRGFSVVADEVRSLAANTQQSTERIQKTINTLQKVAREAVEDMRKSTQQAQAGVLDARENGESFEHVGAAIGTIADMNVQISSATEEQTAVANEINENVTMVARSVSEVVSGAEQSAMASQQLAELAQQLQSEAEKFKV
ncbi:methyl-accepting chemotaxis protein [Nitrincola tibetensis]|uniref:Methyl-accepting chemotaxis protein n=1 Tax=Nitrincola tibetensis TaxID=2219697 RepID=A0A364NN73_9GAMM|nr:methyl-accepting chemotaxis protein [Nitrincola tibetensis]RAU18337.1 methyl-accepting chemotaxis protein [Nitrincola tibetensis]